MRDTTDPVVLDHRKTPDGLAAVAALADVAHDAMPARADVADDAAMPARADVADDAAMPARADVADDAAMPARALDRPQHGLGGHARSRPGSADRQ
jgi:hypothetical protein